MPRVTQWLEWRLLRGSISSSTSSLKVRRTPPSRSEPQAFQWTGPDVHRPALCSAIVDLPRLPGGWAWLAGGEFSR